MPFGQPVNQSPSEQPRAELSTSRADLLTMRRLALADVGDLPHAPGIYIVLDSDGRVLYVGQTSDLRSRWSTHQRRQQAVEIPRVELAYVLCDLEDLKQLERAYITQLQPEWNGQPLPVPSTRRQVSAEDVPTQTSYGMLLTATARLLCACERADRAAALARALNAVTDVVAVLDDRALEAVAAGASNREVLLRLVNSPEFARAWRAADPLAPECQRAAQLKRSLLEAEGGALTVAQVASRLDISKQAVDKRRRARKLLALPTTRGFLYPAWQFTVDGVLPGFEQVLAALHAEAWTQASWFLTGDSRLGDARPLDVLRRGETERVVVAAAAYGEQGAA